MGHPVKAVSRKGIMRFVLILIVIVGVTIGLAVTAAHFLLIPVEENVIWMKGGKLESSTNRGVEGKVHGVVPPEFSASPPAAESRPGTPRQAPAAPARAVDLPSGTRVEAESHLRDVTPPGVLQPPPRNGPLIRIEPRRSETPDPPAKPVIFQRPVVVDAGTLKSGTTTVMLDGVTAPSLDEICTTGQGKQWPCGRRAAAALRMLVRARPLECDPPDPNRAVEPGTYRGRCRVGGVDVARWLLENGWARPSGGDFIPEAEIAKVRKIGLWAQDVGQ